ncbi:MULTISPECIES: SOS response-associated peptidase [Bacillaceae]|uniref:Abasic site processing protein n=1 Tax=Evansella alkalicola TaxID=745819 RepID=A0ABS6JNQ9_9BACI|nr:MULTISPECIES: SOS response-associated peptidase [Bacillaceae]MBU9720070.1 SOS response-associated peptidase [Bacillus alkalicola]
MCGRFTLYADPDFLEGYFDLENGEDLYWEPRYNIAPGQNIFTVVQGKDRLRGGLMKWGLIPPWAKDTSIGYRMINARSETAHEKPSFRKSLNRKHCLIVANGFYEWKKVDGKKQPFYIHYTNGEPVVMAGIWERWKPILGDEVISCSILTTEANEFMSTLHHRMPVLLSQDKWKSWLNPTGNSPEDLRKKYFRPITSEALDAYEVSTIVNNARNESPICIEAI